MWLSRRLWSLETPHDPQVGTFFFYKCPGAHTQHTVVSLAGTSDKVKPGMVINLKDRSTGSFCSASTETGSTCLRKTPAMSESFLVVDAGGGYVSFMTGDTRCGPKREICTKGSILICLLDDFFTMRFAF